MPTNTNLTDDEVRSVAEIVLTVVYADDELDEVELASVRGLIAHLTGNDPGATDVDARIAAATVSLARDGYAARMKEARGTLDEELRRRTLDAARRAAEADGMDDAELVRLQVITELLEVG